MVHGLHRQKGRFVSTRDASIRLQEISAACAMGCRTCPNTVASLVSGRGDRQRGSSPPPIKRSRNDAWRGAKDDGPREIWRVSFPDRASSQLMRSDPGILANIEDRTGTTIQVRTTRCGRASLAAG